MERVKFHNINTSDRHISDVASENRCWIRFKDRWVTPDGFINAFGSPEITPESGIRIMNPLVVKRVGREAVKKMIREGKPPEDICNVLDRLFSFEDLIFKKGYTVYPDQVDEVKIVF